MAAAGGGLLMAVTGGLAAWTPSCFFYPPWFSTRVFEYSKQVPRARGLTMKTLFPLLLCLWNFHFGNCVG